MAPMLQSPEIQFAQRLASNEKPTRTRAIKKLRKYLSIRSQKPTGGFSNDELLKIWKGLFYCMWMQDKPLLQEDLAAVISRLIHSLQKTDAQYLFLETFLQTMNREWNGIDRLRLDKFYKLIRMVLRQSFEMLKRGSWDESLVERFGCILSTQVLSAASGAPSGIQFHILDIYMEELATVGAEELTAEQNLKFIDPFCKIAAKTKDRLLMQAIAHSIFDEIVDQSPFAIEDLMKEVQQQGGNVSDDSENKYLSKSKKSTGRQLNGKEAEKNEQNFENDSEGTVEMPEADGEDIGPVLQFDYKAIADRLFELASRTSTPPQNRKIIYRLVKKFQDLNDGIFPQDEYPEEVSTDEDDDELFGSRRRMIKRKNTESLLEKSSEAAKGKDKKKKEGKKIKNTLNGGVKQKKENTEASPAGTSTELKQPCATEESETKAKKKKMKLKESSPKRIEADPSSNHIDGHTGEKRKKKKKTKEAVEDRHDQEDCLEQTAADTKATILSSKGKKMRKLQVLGVNGERPCLEQATPLEQGHPPSELPKNIKKTVELVQVDPAAEQMENSQTKKMMKKKKRKIEAAHPAEVNGLGEHGGKKKKKSCEVTSKKRLQKTKASTETEFVRFENSSFPVPLFFKHAKGVKPRAAKQGLQTPESGSKKVTFGLNNNKTAEFRKTDKSILVSPEGTSRVAFDPQQKPLCGVLKSPLSVLCSRHKKNTPASTKKRATAADFF